MRVRWHTAVTYEEECVEALGYVTASGIAVALGVYWYRLSHRQDSRMQYLIHSSRWVASLYLCNVNGAAVPSVLECVRGWSEVLIDLANLRTFILRTVSSFHNDVQPYFGLDRCRRRSPDTRHAGGSAQTHRG